MGETKQSPKKFFFKVMFVSTFGNLLFGYDTGVLNGTLPCLARPSQLNIDPVLEGLVTSILLLGAATIVPVYLAELALAERRGRVLIQRT